MGPRNERPDAGNAAGAAPGRSDRVVVAITDAVPGTPRPLPRGPRFRPTLRPVAVLGGADVDASGLEPDDVGWFARAPEPPNRAPRPGCQFTVLPRFDGTDADGDYQT